jgi:hypothetical protein
MAGKWLEAKREQRPRPTRKEKDEHQRRGAVQEEKANRKSTAPNQTRWRLLEEKSGDGWTHHVVEGCDVQENAKGQGHHRYFGGNSSVFTLLRYFIIYLLD